MFVMESVEASAIESSSRKSYGFAIPKAMVVLVPAETPPTEIKFL
jgi:hypothetical protein